MPSAVEELIQSEARPRWSVRLLGQRDPGGHIVLVAQQGSHEDQVAVADLRLPEGVVITKGDGRKGHVVGHPLVQHGDVVILEVVDDPVDHLEKESGQGQGEDHRPHTLADPKLLVLHEHVVDSVQRAAAEERGQVIHLADFIFLIIINVQLIAAVQVVPRVPIAVLHPLVVVVEVLARSPAGLVISRERDGAHNPDRHVG